MLKKIIQSCFIVSSLLYAHASFAACTADFDMADQQITNLGEPTNAKDATTKKYVDMGAWTNATEVSGIGGVKKSSYNSLNGLFCIQVSASNVTGANITDSTLLATFNLPKTLDHPIYVRGFEFRKHIVLKIETDGRLFWLATSGNPNFEPNTGFILKAEGCYKL